jgi:hypothetical protein
MSPIETRSSHQAINEGPLSSDSRYNLITWEQQPQQQQPKQGPEVAWAHEVIRKTFRGDEKVHFDGTLHS